MRRIATDHRNHSRAFARLLLSLLLVIVPLFANAAGMTGTDPGTPVSAQMPCHSNDLQLVQVSSATGQDACAHCTGDGAASKCHCCGYAAPAGLVQVCVLAARHPDALPLRSMMTAPLPESSADRLYRPPISHS